MNNKNSDQARPFLETANILEEVAKDMDALGYIGEYENKVLGYLITVSRKLNEPLSGIVVSSSGAGKSRLVETLEILTPPSDVIFTSRLTPQSLYYMKKDFLMHKLLIIEERAGSELADYAIRSLQSKGKLALAAPIKNETVFFEVKGPVSVLETTTSYKLNQENISRCFVLCLDESKEQTERIHKYQRYMKTEKGIEAKETIQRKISFHHSVQELLQKAIVIIPYAEKLYFPSDVPSSRRENQKFLTIIEAITLLYQYQRRRKIKNDLLFIESIPKDYEIASRIFKKCYRNHLLMSHSTSGFLLREIYNIEKDIFTRRDIANYSGWPDHRVRDNIRFLEENGLLEIVKKSKGSETLYRLNNTLKLTEPEELEERSPSTT